MATKLRIAVLTALFITGSAQAIEVIVYHYPDH